MERADTVIVGAGLAGLSAARALHKVGQSVLVLEARDRVGGRTVGQRLHNGFVVEMGGQWVGPYQTEVLSLIEELGLTTTPTYDQGFAVTLYGGEVLRWEMKYGTFGLPDKTLMEIGRLQEVLESLADTVPLTAPWETPNALELDQQTTFQWLQDNTSDQSAIEFYRSIITTLFTAEPWQISFLHFLFYIKSAGKIEAMMSASGGNQESRIVGGSHLISERIAAELGDEAVRLSAPVRSITQRESGAIVSCDGAEYAAENVVVAIPPALAGRITYNPALPALRDHLTQQFPMGSVVKAQVLYETPFWRDSNLAGFTDSMDEPHFFSADSSPDDGSCGVLACFFVAGASNALGAMPAQERQQFTTDCLTRMLGPQAANPVEYVDKVWAEEEFSRGCYGGRLGTGGWTGYGPALVEPVDRIHWAGTETSNISNGYMDGAIRSGYRAADEILAKAASSPSRQPATVADAARR